MVKNRRQLISISIVIIFGISLFYIGTDGFRAFTAETARTNSLIAEQPSLPAVTLEDSLGEFYGFEAFEDKYILMTFFYTACTTVCPILERNVADIFEQVPEQYLGEDIMFLSVSFDTERDTPETLQQYGKYLGVEGENWRMARVPDNNELDHLLSNLGVIAIPDGYGDFQHNVAFYLIDPQGNLIDVMDYEDIAGATERVMEVLRAKEGA